MRIIGVYNIKGGVGKTATAVNLSYLTAQAGYRTLIWDLDPQGASSFYFRVKPKIKGGGKKLIRGKQELDDLVKGTDYENLDLLPADFSYRHMDLVLEKRNKPALQLMKLLRPLSHEYDYIFLDCPPSISLVSENVFQAVDGLLVPMIPTTLSLRTLDQLVAFLDGHKLTHLPLMPFFSMVDRRKRMHLDCLEQLPAKYQGLLRTCIPYSSEVERMGIHRAPLVDYAPSCPAAKAFAALWNEVELRIR